MEIYGQAEPKEIDSKLVKNAKVPIALYVGKDDILVNTED
jgi:hypothetical protein